MCVPHTAHVEGGPREGWAASGWLVHNPVGAPTEREVYTTQVLGAPVYRALLESV